MAGTGPSIREGWRGAAPGNQEQASQARGWQEECLGPGDLGGFLGGWVSSQGEEVGQALEGGSGQITQGFGFEKEFRFLLTRVIEAFGCSCDVILGTRACAK